MTVPAIGPERAAATEEIVDVAGNSDGNAAHAGGQGSLVARFDDQVDVIPLHGEVEDPKACRVALSRATQGEAERRKNVLTTQRAECRTERHVHGVLGKMRRPGAVRHPSAPGHELSPRTDPFAAPRAPKREGLLAAGGALAAERHFELERAIV